jgi:hypothetical protein
MAGFMAAAMSTGSLSSGEDDATAQVDNCLFGHRTHRGVGQDEVAQGAVGGAAHAVDAGDEG